MANLTVWKFNDAEGAQRALKSLTELQKKHLIEIQDAALVSWPEGKKKPRTQQALNLVGLGALDGAFWGILTQPWLPRLNLSGTRISLL